MGIQVRCPKCGERYPGGAGHRCVRKKKTKSVTTTPPHILDPEKLADVSLVIDDEGRLADLADVLSGAEDVCSACGQRIVVVMTGAERQRRFRARKRGGRAAGPS